MIKMFNHFGKDKAKHKDNKKTETWKLTMHGLVQGVGFRWSVLAFAQNQHLKGTVKNNPDSTVTIMLQAPRTEVDRFLNELPRHLSSFAHIDKVDIKKINNVAQMHDFHVLY